MTWRPATRPDDDAVPRSRVCPRCVNRYAGLVDAHCPACAGHGVLRLHPVALHFDEPAVVSRAVELYLERQMKARAAADGRAVARRAVEDLTLARVLAPTAASPDLPVVHQMRGSANRPADAM